MQDDQQKIGGWRSLLVSSEFTSHEIDRDLAQGLEVINCQLGTRDSIIA